MNKIFVALSILVVMGGVIIALLMSSATKCIGLQQFKVGDCIYSAGGAEKIVKITKIGEYSYAGVDSEGQEHFADKRDLHLNQTDCFDIFDKEEGKK